MKTWLSIFLPKDEYKERQMLIFLAEAAVAQVILVLVLFMISQVFLPLPSKFILVICLFSIIIYTGIRYIFSGIEYTEISTEKEYKNQIKALRGKSIGFLAMYVVLCVMFELTGLVSFFEGSMNTLDFFIVSIIAAVLLFGTQYVSLRKSYLKNRDLM